MKKISRKHIEAIRFYEENKDKYSKTKVASMFNSDRHAMLKYYPLYLDVISSADTDDEDYYYFSPEELFAIEEYTNNKYISKQQWCSIHHDICKSPRLLDKWLKVLGIQDILHRNKNYDRRVFSKQPTPEMAYWLGFLLADGCITNKEYAVELKVGEKDKAHLYKFLKFLQAEESDDERYIKQYYGGAYTKDNVCYKIVLCSREMVLDLERYNIIPSKSLKETPVVFNDDSMNINYIRGIIDGDGYVSVSGNSFGLCGSKEVCSYINDFLQEKTNIKIKTKVSEEKTKNGKTIYRIKFVKKDFVKASLKLLYESSDIFLDRKYNAAIAVLKSLN